MNEHGKKQEPEPSTASETAELVDAEPETNTADIPITAEDTETDPTEAPPSSPPQETPDFEAQAKDYYDRLLRTTADFENFRKRAARERQESIAFANETLLKKLLTVLDSFDKALAAAESKETTVESLQTGINLILQQFKSVLAEAGLTEINATDQAFDPNWHEAISQQPTDEAPDGQVIQQVRKGYKLRDRLLRAAMVIVATKPEPGTSEP